MEINLDNFEYFEKFFQFEYVNGNLRMREEEQRRLVAKQHSTRLISPPPAKKQQLQTIHSQQVIINFIPY